MYAITLNRKLYGENYYTGLNLRGYPVFQPHVDRLIKTYVRAGNAARRCKIVNTMADGAARVKEMTPGEMATLECDRQRYSKQ